MSLVMIFQIQLCLKERRFNGGCIKDEHKSNFSFSREVFLFVLVYASFHLQWILGMILQWLEACIQWGSGMLGTAALLLDRS